MNTSALGMQSLAPMTGVGEDGSGAMEIESSGGGPAYVEDDSESPMWSLPDEILLAMLQRLEISDLCSVIQTCRRLYTLGTSRVVLASTRFPSDAWPFVSRPREPVPSAPTSPGHAAAITQTNRPVFERAARAGNFEANIKLGVALLYGEGLESNAEHAYEMLNRAEELVGSVFPFAWLLFRPPWSSQSCSKAAIFRQMKKQATENMPSWTRKHCGILFCVAKTLSLLPEASTNKDAETWFENAASKGCGDAAFELYKLRNSSASHYDVGARTENIRALRGYESSASWNVMAALCSEYAAGNFAGKSPAAAQRYFRNAVLSSSRLTAAHQLNTSQTDLDKDGKMRYILVDWLVEVADLKAFSRDTLYMTVGLVDRYLDRFKVTRKTLQLLGISCMVIAARFTENEVITIREAAWLTDNTYKYEQVVRTMGSALCAAGGRLRVPTTLDFIRLFVAIEKVPQNVEEVLHYVSELVLLNIPVGHIPPGLMAAAVYFLTAMGMQLPQHLWWPERLSAWTGLSLVDIGSVVYRVQLECFRNEDVMDHREEKLKAVADRYSRKSGHKLEESGFIAPETPVVDRILREQGAIGTMDDEVDEDESMFGQDSSEMAGAGHAMAVGTGEDFLDAADAMDQSPESQAHAHQFVQSECDNGTGGAAFPLSSIGNVMPAASFAAGSKQPLRHPSDPGRQQTPTDLASANFPFGPAGTLPNGGRP